MLRIIIIVLCILILLILLLGIGIYIFVTQPKKIPHDKGEAIEREKGFWGDFDSYEKEELNITVRDGYLLHGLFVPAQTDTNKYVIITHGYTYSYAGSVKYANLFHLLGFHVYLYDLRHHGYNEPYYCSMGRNEGRDVADVYQYFRDRYGKDAIIGLHGESLGCASSVFALGYKTDIDFLIADCGFADFDLLAHYLAGHLMHLPGFLSHFASIISVFRRGFRLDHVRPIEAFQKNDKTPVLFIHGEADTFIPKVHSEMNYAACKAAKRMVFFGGADHAQSYEVDTERYVHEIEQFLTDFVLS